jgi:four helix bundle protein
MRDYTRLRAFELADNVALLVYQLTADFPKPEIYGLAAQMRRAAVSVPSNIVEGCSRRSHAEFIRYLEIAFGSVRELRYQFGLAKRLGLFQAQNTLACEDSLAETEKVLHALIHSQLNMKHKSPV